MALESRSPLSPVERSVVAIGLQDADNAWTPLLFDGSFGARLLRLGRTLGGSRDRPPLADAKLELLRQFVWRTRRQHRPAEQLIPTLIEHGYHIEQIRSLAALAA